MFLGVSNTFRMCFPALPSVSGSSLFLTLTATRYPSEINHKDNISQFLVLHCISL